MLRWLLPLQWYEVVMARAKYVHYSRIHSVPTHSSRPVVLSMIAGTLVLASILGFIVMRDSLFSSDTLPGDSKQTPGAAAEPDRPVIFGNRTYENALEEKAIEELHRFGGWLKANNAKGFIGELGWPSGPD